MQIFTVENAARNFGWINVDSKDKIANSIDKDKYDEIFLKSCAKSTVKVCLWILFYQLTILASALILSVPATIIPLTNSIDYPGYWWEPIITGGFFVNSLYESAYTLVECKLYYGFEFLFSFKTLAWLWAIMMLAMSIPYVIAYLVWSVMLGYNHPIPLLGIICYLSWNVALFIAIWFLFPEQLRRRYGSEIRTYIWYRLWFFFSSQQKNALSMILGLLPSGFQWIMAFVLPQFFLFSIPYRMACRR